MTREEIIKEIKETEERLSELKDKLDNTPTTSLKEQFQNVLTLGCYKCSLIKRSKYGVIDNYIENCNRYETVYITDIIESVLEDNIVDNYDDYLEISDILGVENILSEDKYDELIQNGEIDEADKEYFLEFINDVIEAGVSEFKMDW